MIHPLIARRTICIIRGRGGIVVIENAYVCYFDVLGFTSRFVSGSLSTRYDGLIAMVNGINDDKVTVFLMSDSIVIVSEEFDRFMDITREFYTWGILNDFWLRGAVTRGNVTRYHDKAVMERNRFILPFLGEGYLRAYALETSLNISAVGLDRAFLNRQDIAGHLTEGIDYVEYEEYVPKQGYEENKWLLLPKEHTVRQVVDTLYFDEMLKSHVEDVDKYINTFCFYIRYLLERGSVENIFAFLDRLMDEFDLQGRRILIPSKVVTIFVAVIEGLFRRYRSADGLHHCNPAQLELLVGKVVSGLREQGYLSAFVDILLEFDKKRHTTLYKEINSLRLYPQAQ